MCMYKYKYRYKVQVLVGTGARRYVQVQVLVGGTDVCRSDMGKPCPPCPFRTRWPRRCAARPEIF